MNLIDFSLVGPALTAHLARRSGEARGNRLCQRHAQIEIPAYALLVRAIHAEHRFGVLGMEGKLDLFALVDASGLKMDKIRRQRLQFWKLY